MLFSASSPKRLSAANTQGWRSPPTQSWDILDRRATPRFHADYTGDRVRLPPQCVRRDANAQHAGRMRSGSHASACQLRARNVRAHLASHSMKKSDAAREGTSKRRGRLLQHARARVPSFAAMPPDSIAARATTPAFARRSRQPYHSPSRLCVLPASRWHPARCSRREDFHVGRDMDEVRRIARHDLPGLFPARKSGVQRVINASTHHPAPPRFANGFLIIGQ